MKNYVTGSVGKSHVIRMMISDISNAQMKMYTAATFSSLYKILYY